MDKRILCFFLALLLAVSLFTGCEEENDIPPTTPAALTLEETIIYDYYFTVESLFFRLHNPISSISLRFRGAFSDTYVVFVDGPFEYSTENIDEYVNGIRFRFPMGKRLYAYHQGSFYTLTEAFEQGFLTANDVQQLKINYSSLGNDRDVKGEVPTEWAECTHNGNVPPTNPNKPTQPATEPTQPTESAATTQPTEPVDIMELLPDIPAVTEPCAKPDVLNELTLVHTFYEHSASWFDKKGIEQIVTVQLPAIVPFCDGAIEINEAIRSTYQYRIESIRHDFTYQRSSIQMVYFKTWLYDNILTIQVSVWEDFNVTRSNFWILDVATGKQLTTPELAQRYLQESYPTFLQHCYYNTYAYFQSNPLMNTKDQEELMRLLPTHPFFVLPSYTLYPDSAGNLKISLRIPEYDVNLTLPYDAFDDYGWEGNDESGYHWLFSAKADGAGAEIHGQYLLTSFFQDPHTFVKMLSQEEDAAITDVAQLLNYSLYYPEDIARYKDLCDDVYLISSDSKIAETAQILYNHIQPL